MPIYTGERAPPEWLSRFVRDEVRPLLIENRQVALDALERWLAHRQECNRRLRDWERRQLQFLEGRMVPAPADHDRFTADGNPHEPCEDQSPEDVRLNGPEGLTLIVGTVLDEGRPRTVYGWGPPELSEEHKPRFEHVLPPPLNRDLTTDECWVALIAVHDAVRHASERIAPTDSTTLVVLRDKAAKLSEARLPDLRAAALAPLLSKHSIAETPDSARATGKKCNGNNKGRGRGHPGLDAATRKQMVKVYDDYKATGLTQREYLSVRGYFPGKTLKQSLAYLDACRKQREKAQESNPVKATE